MSENHVKPMEVATTDLVVTHPIRLGLALNFSVFHYEVLRSSLYFSIWCPKSNF